MSTEAVTTTTTTSDRQGRSATKQDRRCGRSRSPSAYLHKKGNGLLGIISGESIRKSFKKSRSATSLLLLSRKSSNKAIDDKEENKTTDKSSIANKPSEEEISDSDFNTDKVEEYGKETVQFILLLVELQMEQIELLQLEFDPNKALVHDILAQIPKSATFDGIKNQLYEGVCSVDGEEMPNEMLLKNFVKAENEVKLAIPGGMTGIECAKIAAPILTDKKVRALLQRLGTSHVSFGSILPFKEADDESSTFAIEVIEPITEDRSAEEKAVTQDDNHSPSMETYDVETELEVIEIKESVNERSTTNIDIYEEPARKNLSVEKFKEIVSGGVKVVSGKVKAVSNKVRAINIEKLTSQSKPVGIDVALLLLILMIIVAAMLSTATMPWSSGSTMKAGQISRKCGIADFFKSTKHCDGMSAIF